MRNITILGFVALLAACGSETSGTVTGADGETTSYEVDREGDSAEMRITTEDGESAVINTGSADAALPLGFTTYPGATVVSNSRIETGDGKGSVLFQTTSASPADVAAFYRRQAEAAGISISMEQTANEARTIAGEGADGKNFMMTASPGPDGTGVQLMIGEQP